MATPDRQLAARQAAAKHSTNRTLATIEYAKLSGQFDQNLSEEKIKTLAEEMLSILPAYRHPTFDEYGEYIWFIDPEGIKIEATAYNNPRFLTKLEDIEIDRELLTEIQIYVKEAESQKLNLANCSEELKELRTIFSKAQIIYSEYTNERADKRNSLVVQAIGLSRGVVPKRIDKKKAYIDYVRFVRENGMSRKNAAVKVQNKYDINSYDATLKMLYEYRGTIFRKFKTLHPTLLPKLRTLLKGFIPSRR